MASLLSAAEPEAAAEPEEPSIATGATSGRGEPAAAEEPTAKRAKTEEKGEVLAIVPAKDRYLRARERGFLGYSREEEGEWKGDFLFIQLADTQLGMLKGDESWEEEMAVIRAAIAHINRLQPRFVVVCGDLVNAYPGLEDKTVTRAAQVRDFKSLMAGIDDHIPLVCICGNHDVGNTPTRTTIADYVSDFGDDYFSFWVGGVRFISLNTQMHSDPSGAPELAEAQDTWLEEEAELTDEVKPVHTVAFSHIPPFINDPEEDDGYFNLSPRQRRNLLSTMKRARCCKWFCGHYHRNAGGWDEDLEVVVSSAVGTVLEPSGTDPLGLKGFTWPGRLGPAHSGLRVVKVTKEEVSHAWYTIDSVPD